MPRSSSRTLVISIVALGIAACLPAFAPGITSLDHHSSVSGASEDDECLQCHETEGRMYKRMVGMEKEELGRHLDAEHHRGMPPLVADWMVDDERSCLECHTLGEVW